MEVGADGFGFEGVFEEAVEEAITFVRVGGEVGGGDHFFGAGEGGVSVGELGGPMFEGVGEFVGGLIAGGEATGVVLSVFMDAAEEVAADESAGFIHVRFGADEGPAGA